jgi:hypothetical protein
MTASSLVYCDRCKIGTLDPDGLCVLCGAPKVAPSAGRRALAAVLSFVTSAPAIAMATAALILGAALSVGRYAPPPGSMATQLALLNPLTVPLAVRNNPHGTLIAILGPIIGQAIIVLVILMILFLFVRRRRGERQGAAETY